MDTTDIHLLPSVNPDGNVVETRHNANDEDLNRAFPGWMELGKPRNELSKDREREVRAMMSWILDNPFVLSISFHASMMFFIHNDFRRYGWKVLKYQHLTGNIVKLFLLKLKLTNLLS